jgi:hypothetical protein
MGDVNNAKGVRMTTTQEKTWRSEREQERLLNLKKSFSLPLQQVRTLDKIKQQLEQQERKQNDTNNNK